MRARRGVVLNDLFLSTTINVDCLIVCCEQYYRRGLTPPLPTKPPLLYYTPCSMYTGTRTKVCVNGCSLIHFSLHTSAHTFAGLN